MPVFLLCLMSCSREKRYACEDYIINSPTAYTSDNGYNILQLSDTHISNQSDRDLQYRFIKKTIDLSKSYLAERNKTLDLIIITGDVFTFSTRIVSNEFFSFLDSQKVYWTCTFGNHDEQAYYSIDWLTGRLNELNRVREESQQSGEPKSYCVFKDLQDDDVFGNANFVINIRDKNNRNIEQLYMFDSNRYNYGDGASYDCIHYDQIDWYDRMVRYFCPNGALILPSLAFFHIPLQEYLTIYDAAINDETKSEDNRENIFLKDVGTGQILKERREKGSPSKINTHLYDKMKELRSTVGVFVGHDHRNSFAAMNKNDNIVMSYGVKATDSIYSDEDLLGGQLIMIKKNIIGENPDLNENFDIHQILHKYADLGGNQYE